MFSSKTTKFHKQVWVIMLFSLFFSSPSFSQPPNKSERVPWKPPLKGEAPAFRNTDWRPSYHVPKGWRPRYFHYETRYRLVETSYFGPVIETFADGTASWISRPLNHKFDKTSPSCINWVWSADKLPTITKSETTFEGDDYALRVYVFGRLENGKSYGFTYVWSQEHKKGDIWKSPYSDNKIMSLRSGENLTDELIYESRNLTKDIKQALGAIPVTIAGIAIMTDSDASNTLAKARISPISVGACRLIS